MKSSNHKSSILNFYRKKALRIFSIFFLFVFLVELISEFFYHQSPILHFIAKPLVMISLASFFYIQSGGFKSVRDVWVFMGLILSLFGDIFLMFGGDLWFMLGLGSFLFAHISYIIAFWRFSEPAIQEGRPRLISKKPWQVVPFLLYGAFLIWVINPGLGGLTIPVYIYAAVIMLMAIVALNRWGGVSHYSFAFVFLGALLFIISDSVLAANKFASDRFPIPLVDYWIMITYMAAQYLIVVGMLMEKWQPRDQVSGMN